MENNISIRLLRNATVVINISGRSFLIDPIFSDKFENDPVPWSNETRNPTVDLPVGESELEKIITETDAVLITHTHRDHWDAKAQQLIPKNKFIVCQPEDEGLLTEQGFTNLNSDVKSNPGEINVERVPAQHGHGELIEKMAPASGFIIQDKSITIYVAGDAVWDEVTAKNIDQFQPDYIIVNAGAAQFNFGEPITMTAADVIETAKHSKSSAKIIVVHMEAVNHCYLTRTVLNATINKHGFTSKIFVPEDGETISFN